MTGPKELALFTAAVAAVVLLSGAASGQDFRHPGHPGPPVPHLPPLPSLQAPYWRTGGLAGRRRRVGVPLRRYPTTGYGAAEEEEGEARRRRREGIVEEAVDTGICPLSHLTP